jgi:hypothetical protein
VQVIVPKRTALLLDRIMTALQKAVEDEKGGPNFAPDPAENKVLTYVSYTTYVPLLLWDAVWTLPINVQHS